MVDYWIWLDVLSFGRRKHGRITGSPSVRWGYRRYRLLEHQEHDLLRSLWEIGL